MLSSETFAFPTASLHTAERFYKLGSILSIITKTFGKIKLLFSRIVLQQNVSFTTGVKCFVAIHTRIKCIWFLINFLFIVFLFFSFFTRKANKLFYMSLMMALTLIHSIDCARFMSKFLSKRINLVTRYTYDTHHIFKCVKLTVNLSMSTVLASFFYRRKCS